MHILSRRCKNVENVHETFINIQKFPFKKRTFPDHRVYKMYLKFLQKPGCFGWFKNSSKQAKRSDPP